MFGGMFFRFVSSFSLALVLLLDEEVGWEG
jgi:hypothetical protein